MNEMLGPKCRRPGAVKNGPVASSGQQNGRCRACGRQGVANPRGHSLTDAEKGVARALLKERVSLRGIARVRFPAGAQSSLLFQEAGPSHRGHQALRR